MLDPDRPDGVRLSVTEAHTLGEAALQRIGYPADEAAIISDQLIDNALCGYRFASLPRILRSAKMRRPAGRGWRFALCVRRRYLRWSMAATR
jgi:hypothetical protein